MKLQCTWHEKLRFSAEAEGHRVELDSKRPLGDDSAMTPKQLLLAAICGCTAMDVVSLMKKYHQTLEKFEIDAESESSDSGYPVVFTAVKLVFKLKGAIDRERALEAVRLSQTKYCGVSAMVSKAVPITYTVELNGEAIGEGRAEFG